MDYSAIVIAANEDLLTEILLRLPVKPLLRFKCVSKHWYSLITNPHLHRLNNPKNKITGLIVLRQDKSYATKFEYDVIPLYRTPKLPHDYISRCVQSVHRKRMEILHSCNGLICLRFHEKFDEKYDYYVCNPTTRQCRRLPSLKELDEDEVEEDSSVIGRFANLLADSVNVPASIIAMQLAFDPRKSSHYKVLCLYLTQSSAAVEMRIYSSEVGLWKRQTCGNHLTIRSIKFIPPEPRLWMCSQRPKFQRITHNIKEGVFWNGAMNWLNFNEGDGLYFNVEEARFGKWPMLPQSDGPGQRNIKYFGGSGDHMFIVVLYDPHATNFEVYEMDKEYLGWFIKYRVDVEVVMNSSIYPKTLGDCGFDIISVVLGDSEEDSSVVIGIPGLAICYNLGDESFKTIWNFCGSSVHYIRPMYGWFDVFHCVESISSV